MTDLAALVAATRSLRFERAAPSRIDAIAIVGATCSGKTTVVAAVRAAAIEGVDVPRRFVTRAPRPDDAAAEAGYLTPEQLDAAIAAGDVGVWWSRELEVGRAERYAFALPAPGSLPVYSANNALYAPGNAHPAGAFVNALLIGVYAPDAVRDQRLRARSPALLRDRPNEARARMAERADAMRSRVHIVIQNHGALEADAPADLVALVRAVQLRYRCALTPSATQAR